MTNQFDTNPSSEKWNLEITERSNQRDTVCSKSKKALASTSTLLYPVTLWGGGCCIVCSIRGNAGVAAAAVLDQSSELSLWFRGQVEWFVYPRSTGCWNFELKGYLERRRKQENLGRQVTFHHSVTMSHHVLEQRSRLKHLYCEVHYTAQLIRFHLTQRISPARSTDEYDYRNRWFQHEQNARGRYWTSS